MTQRSSKAPSSDAAWVVYSARGSVLGRRNIAAACLESLLASRDLTRRLLVRELRARYRQSLLGWLWAFAPPLVLTISFTLAGQAEIFNIGNTPVPYPLFALIGTVLWQSFTEAIQGPIQSCHQARTLLTRIRFPYEAILISKAADVALNSLLRLLLVAAAMAWYQVGPGWTVLLLPLAMAALLGLGTALGMALAPLATIVDDIKHGLNVVLSVWFFVTPIMYHQPAAGSAIATLNRLNPVTPLLATSRAWLLGLETPTPVGFAVLAGVIPLLLLVSWVFFRMSIPIAVERIGA